MSGNYFGDCPKCGNCDGYLNVNRNHWNFCDKCKTKWPIGSNLFSSWKDETEEVWKKNAEKLSEYEEVEPVYITSELPLKDFLSELQAYQTNGELMGLGDTEEGQRILKALRGILPEDIKTLLVKLEEEKKANAKRAVEHLLSQKYQFSRIVIDGMCFEITKDNEIRGEEKESIPF